MTDVLPTTNGRQAGRAAPLPTFTFPDSGITVSLRRLAPGTQEQILHAVESDAAWCAAHPKPEPPLQAVTDLEGKTEQIPNPDEPGYIQALDAYTSALVAELGERLLALALRQVVVEVDEAAVKRLRDDMAAIGAPFPADADDREIYISRICISSVFDLSALLAYIQGRSGPTGAAIAQHRAMFPG